jgi:hypothetical protein
MLCLVERAQEQYDEKKLEKNQKKMLKNNSVLTISFLSKSKMGAKILWNDSWAGKALKDVEGEDDAFKT